MSSKVIKEDLHRLIEEETDEKVLQSIYEILKSDEGDSREDIIANLTQAFKDLKLYKEGKLKTTPAKDFLDELSS